MRWGIALSALGPALGVVLGTIALGFILGGTVTESGFEEKNGLKWNWFLHRNGTNWSPTIIFPSGYELEIGPYKKEGLALTEVKRLAADFAQSGAESGGVGGGIGSGRRGTLRSNRQSFTANANTNLVS